MENINIVTLFALSGAVNSIVAFAIGVAIIFSNPRKFVNQLFFLLSMATALWGVGYYFWLVADTEDVARRWIGILNVGSTYIPILYYHWICIMLNLKRRKIIAIFYVISIIFSLFSFSHFYVDHVVAIGDFKYWPQAGILYPYFVIILYGGLFLAGLIENLRVLSQKKNSHNKKDVVRRHKIAQYTFLALFFAGIAGATNFLMWFGVVIPPYGNFFVVLQMLIFAYAIFKYNMMQAQQAMVSFTVALVVIALTSEILLSKSFLELFFRAVTLVIFLYFARLMVRSFEREVYEREKSQKLLKKLRIANEKLRSLDKAKSEMLSIAAHQLRTPITAMNGYLSLLLEGDAGIELKGTPKKMVTRVSHATNRLAQLVNNLLNMSRIDEGRMQYIMRQVHIENIAREAVDTFRIVAEEKGLRLIFKNVRGTLPKVRADENKMYEVFSNLINNAIKYTQTGEVTVRVHVNKDKKVCFCVTDTGVGFSKSVAGKLFKKFERADRKQMNAEGAGIGLYVAYNIVRDHGGHIIADSDGEGKGAKFTVVLDVIE